MQTAQSNTWSKKAVNGAEKGYTINRKRIFLPCHCGNVESIAAVIGLLTENKYNKALSQLPAVTKQNY